jgi:AraC-like DNA-binding protein
LFSEAVTDCRRFHLPAPQHDARGFAVVSAGWENCAPDYDVHRRDFPFYAVEFVNAGTGSLQLGNEVHDLLPGTVFTYGPGVSHRICNTCASGLSKYFVDFTGPAAAALLKEYAPLGEHPIRLGRTDEVRGVFELLIRSGRAGDKRSVRMTSLALELLLDAIVASLVFDTPAVRRRREAFTRCRTYIDDHFLRLASVDQIATECHLHRSHLCRLFREFTDSTPLHYLLRRRMEWAADRLLNSNVLVRQAADELGMDPFQFSRTFKRVIGVAPANLVRAPHALSAQKLAS